jgi:hypothetical protein
MNKAQFMKFAADMAHDCFDVAEENNDDDIGSRSNAEMARMLSDFLLGYAECSEEMEASDKHAAYEAARG